MKYYEIKCVRSCFQQIKPHLNNDIRNKDVDIYTKMLTIALVHINTWGFLNFPMCLWTQKSPLCACVLFAKVALFMDSKNSFLGAVVDKHYARLLL